jgi:predicted RNase H-like HicB family nuclease
VHPSSEALQAALEIGEWSQGIGERRYPIYVELIFEVRDAQEGGFFARALGHSIFTQGDTWDELRANALEVASLHFEGEEVRPRLVQLH